MTPLRLGPRADIALLLLRVVIGAAFIVHGFPKIHHPGTWGARMLPHVPAWLLAIAAFAEFGGGIALVAGFLTPLFAFMIACDMVVAIFFVALPRGATFVGGTAHGPTFELELAYLAIAIVLMLVGPGAYSLDGARAAAGTTKRRRR